MPEQTIAETTEQYHLPPLSKDAIEDTFSEFVADFQGAKKAAENKFLSENPELYHFLIQRAGYFPGDEQNYWNGILMMREMLTR